MFNGRGPENRPPVWIWAVWSWEKKTNNDNCWLTVTGFACPPLPTPPKKYKIRPCQILEAVNVTLFGKSVCANVIRLRILRWNHLGLSGWALNPMTSVLKRKRQSHFRRSQQLWAGFSLPGGQRQPFPATQAALWSWSQGGSLLPRVRAGRERQTRTVCPWSHAT